MQQQQRSENETDNNRNDQESGAGISSLTGIGIAIWVFAIGGAILWVVIHDNVADTAKSFEVFIASIFSLALVIVVVIQAGIYFRQSRALDAQRQIMEDTLAETRRIFDLTERPVIVVESASIANLAANQPLSPTIIIINKGRTPAQNITITLQIAAKAGYVYALGFGNEWARESFITFLANGDGMTIEGAPADAVTIDDAFYDGAIKGSEALMVHGKGSYEDLAGRQYPIEEYAFHYRQKYGFIPDYSIASLRRINERYAKEREKTEQNKTNEPN